MAVIFGRSSVAKNSNNVLISFKIFKIALTTFTRHIIINVFSQNSFLKVTIFFITTGICLHNLTLFHPQQYYK